MIKLCITGDPVVQSKSPLIQTAMMRALGLDGSYDRQLVRTGETADWLRRALAEGYTGFNATSPQKEALVPLMDVLDEDAKLYGAVNTVCIQDGVYYGFNTDGLGFAATLTELGFSCGGATVTVLGAGGAAKAVALKLVQQGAKAVFVCNRTPERAQALCAQDSMGRLTPAGFDRGTLTRLAARSDLLVNCTTLGMAGKVYQFEDFAFLDALPAAAPAYDLIYAPERTELLAQAEARGHVIQNGLSMLAYQAVFALEHFAQRSIDPVAMLPVIREALS